MFEFVSDDKCREECGVMGVFGNPKAAHLVYLGLFALQHRGQEACGIVTFDPVKQPQSPSQKIHTHKAYGLVSDNFTKDILERLPGNHGLGHVRYSTQGGRLVENIQPFQFKTSLGPMAIAHNGNLTNAKDIRKRLEDSGSIFQSTSDTEVFIHLIARSAKTSIRERIFDAMAQVDGAYSLVIMTEEQMFAVRDSCGFRPLVLGHLDSAAVVCSESCALDLIGAEYVRSLEPGEVLEISKNDLKTASKTKGPGKSYFPREKKTERFCSFEPIYFSRPDSHFMGMSMYEVRRRLGMVLAEESPAEADFVIPIPDSGVPMAIGYGSQVGLPVELALVRNHYIGRTFIEPTQDIRDFGVRLKLNPVASVLKDKRIVVVDDSLVRGTTSAKIFRLLRAAGAKEIHFRIGSPPMTHSCFYGVDTPDRANLLAAQKNVPQICEMLGADSLAFLSLEGLKIALGVADRHCFSCFTGKYMEAIHAEIPLQPTDSLGPGLRANIMAPQKGHT